MGDEDERTAVAVAGADGGGKRTANGLPRDDVARVVIQALDDMGYGESARTLERESGLRAQSPAMERFRSAVVAGDWAALDDILPTILPAARGEERDAAVAMAHDSSMSTTVAAAAEPPAARAAASSSASASSAGVLLEPSANKTDNMTQIRFLVREQQYLELLEQAQVDEALDVLRTKITPLDVPRAVVADLAALIMCQSAEEVRGRTGWDGAQGKSRDAVLRAVHRRLSPALFVPEQRLFTLLARAVARRCTCTSPPSLLADHVCQPMALPDTCVAVLEYQPTEIWYVAFSPTGKYLASAALDGSVAVYEMSMEGGRKPSLFAYFASHSDAVAFLAWSPDGRRLASCGNDGQVVIHSLAGEEEVVLDLHQGPVTACAWLPDSEQLVTAGVDKMMFLWKIGQPGPVRQWRGRRFKDVAVASTGRMLVAAADRDVVLFSLTATTNVPLLSIREDRLVTSIALAADDEHVLINMPGKEVSGVMPPRDDGDDVAEQDDTVAAEIHLWSLATGVPRLVQTYSGHVQERFVIRSRFAGRGQGLIACGSEDSVVYVYSRADGGIVAELQGHTAIVNGVSCNPADPDMLASASDDNTVRLWLPAARAAAIGATSPTK